jgi:protein O-GlcNAc transferase
MPDEHDERVSSAAGETPPQCVDLLRRAKELLTAPPDPRLSPLAIELARSAWKLAPGDPAVAVRLARALCFHGLEEEAVAVCDESLEAHPEALELRVERVLLALPMYYRDSEHLTGARATYDRRLAELELYFESVSRQELVRLGRLTHHLFPSRLPYQAKDDADLQRRMGALVSRAVSAAFPGQRVTLSGRDRPLRVGFVSNQFWSHTMWHVITRGWLSGLSERGLDCYGYAVGGREDGQTEVARSVCRRFVSGERSAGEWADIIAADELDALIYPALSYSGVVDRLAFLRLAPVQCTTFGECETSGSPEMDYFLSSDLMEPADGDRDYTEQLVRLPDLALSYPGRRGEASELGRDHPGLREDAVLYFSPHLVIKYLPRHDELYARIAADVPDAQFVFVKDRRIERSSRVLLQRLREAFSARGVDPEGRLIFLDRLLHADYLSLLQHADVYLDVPGWNGGTTTAEALVWHVPVVTLRGGLARSRMGAAMLQHVGVADGLAADEDEYVRMAAELGHDPARREAVRERLRQASGLISDDTARLDGLAVFLTTAVQAAR